VALVGYTNAGKSSLMRALTAARSTSPTSSSRRSTPPCAPLHPPPRRAVLVSDTVGFIKKLPHDLVASFRSTLDEAREASLLLFVADASDPTFRAQLEVTLRTVLVTDLREILAMTVPLNLVLSTYLVGRYYQHIDRAFLFKRLLPLMLLGMPVGIYAFTALDASLLKRAFGVFVAGVAGLELYRAIQKVKPHPVGTGVEVGLLLTGGAIHGAFSTGGPMAVYVTSRVIHDKAAYRATLSALWLVLGTVLLGSYVYEGRVTTGTLTQTLTVSPGIVLGMVLGEVAFSRVPADLFRRIVFVTLLCSGLALLLRG
jgi:uncharacterized membrane protein YfcA